MNLRVTSSIEAAHRVSTTSLLVTDHSLAVRRELDVPHRLFEVEVMEDGRPFEVDEDGPTVCENVCDANQPSLRVDEPCEGQRDNTPSSTEMRTFASGERAIRAMFFRFSNASVRDLLL